MKEHRRSAGQHGLWPGETLTICHAFPAVVWLQTSAGCCPFAARSLASWWGAPGGTRVLVHLIGRSRAQTDDLQTPRWPNSHPTAHAVTPLSATRPSLIRLAARSSSRSAPPRRVSQTSQALLDESLPPLRDNLTWDAQARADLVVPQPLCRKQDHLCSHDVAIR